MALTNLKGSRNKNIEATNPNSLKGLYADNSMGARDARAQLFSFDKNKENSSKRDQSEINTVTHHIFYQFRKIT